VSIWRFRQGRPRGVTINHYNYLPRRSLSPGTDRTSGK